MTPEEVHDVSFRKPSIGQRGYDENTVDHLLDRVEDALRGTRSISRDELLAASSALPKPPMGKRGYDKDEVDAFIQRVLLDLGTVHAQGHDSGPATTNDDHPTLSERRAHWQGPSIVASGDHRPKTRVACLYALLWASAGAIVAGINIDFFVATGDRPYGAPGYIANASRSAMLTGAAVAATGTLVLWRLWRLAPLTLLWDRGGLAYRGWATRRGAIAWRDVTGIRAMDGSAAFVVVEAHVPQIADRFELVIGSSRAGTRGRWSVWTYSQQQLIETLEGARAAAVTSRFPPPPPSPPRAPGFLRLLIPLWFTLAGVITVAVYAADRGSNFALQHLFWDSRGG